MAQTFLLPAIGDTMVEGQIIEWFVDVGDTVALDQTICSIETDKSEVELTTPYRGVVLQLGGSPGDRIEVGATLIVVGEAGGVADPLGDPDLVLSPVVRRLADQHGIDLATVVGSGVGGRITRADIEAAATGAESPSTSIDAAASSGRGLAMPQVRRAARQRGIDLADVAGTGPRGSVTLDDLDKLDRSTERREPLSATRRSIAAHLSESARTIPQFTAMVEVDATALLATRAALADRLDTPVPLDALFVSLLIPVLRDHPVTNAAYDRDDVVFFDRYDIGLAVDTPAGLMVPVIHSAGERSAAELVAEVARLAMAARDRTITPAELTGATCTVNNVGAVGLTAGTPILPLGTSTIVAFGRARPTVELREGSPVEVPIMTLSATFDHRIIDGGDAGRFLTQLKQHLEIPALGLL